MACDRETTPCGAQAHSLSGPAPGHREDIRVDQIQAARGTSNFGGRRPEWGALRAERIFGRVATDRNTVHCTIVSVYDEYMTCSLLLSALYAVDVCPECWPNATKRLPSAGTWGTAPPAANCPVGGGHRRAQPAATTAGTAPQAALVDWLYM